METVRRGITLDDRHLDGLIGCRGGPRRPSKPRIVPMEGFRLQPLRLARLARVFDDDAHAVPAIVIGEITEHPNPGGPPMPQARPRPARRSSSARSPSTQPRGCFISTIAEMRSAVPSHRTGTSAGGGTRLASSDNTP